MFPIEKARDKFIAAIGRKFAIVIWDGKSGVVSDVDIICEIDTEPEFAMNRLNGGKVDPYGILWAGNTRIIIKLFGQWFMKKLTTLLYVEKWFTLPERATLIGSE